MRISRLNHFFMAISALNLDDDLDLKSFRKRLYEQKCAYYSIKFQMRQRGPATTPNVKDVQKKVMAGLGNVLRRHKEGRELPTKLHKELVKVERMNHLK